MYKFNRRNFLKLFGQGAAVLGLGLSGKSSIRTEPAWAETGSGRGKYQIFQPGEYLDFEKEMIEERFALAEKGPPESDGSVQAVKEDELLKWNRNWDPYNPLFNDKAYAQKAGYPDVPAFPCYTHSSGPIGLVSIPEDAGDIRYIGHGPNDNYYYRHIFAGDSLTFENEKLMMEELTVPGSDFRHFKNGSIAKTYNQKGELVARCSLWRRESYRKIIDGSPAPDARQLALAQEGDKPPAHYTTDEEWEYIKELWGKEYIRGSQKLYWEDVNIGDEPAWVCSCPVSYMDMVGWHGGDRIDGRPAILKGDLKHTFRDRFGNYLFGVAGMYGGRNIPGARALMYNSTSAFLTTRLVTNYIGDAGLVTRIGWMFQQTQPHMRYEQEGGEYLDKVPYMKGKACTHHPTEGDTVISKGYVTNKYKNDKGEGIIDLVCWAETLDDRIIEVVPAAARLPLKKG